MPSYDFEVDLPLLAKAASEAAGFIKDFRDKDVEDFVPPEMALGNKTAWKATENFKDRWEVGVNNLVEDIEAVVSVLGQIANNYAEFDESAAATVKPSADAMGKLKVRSVAGGGDGGR